LPRFDPATVVVTPAPEVFGDASSVVRVTPAFRRVAAEGEYWLLSGVADRLAAVLVDAARANTPAAVVIPLDTSFAARADAAVRLWRIATGRPSRRAPARLTQHQRRRLTLALRALDGRLAGATYREIARALFGAARIPIGPAWKTHDVRDRTIRLVRTGLDFMRGSYLDLLRYPLPRGGS
jgi:hypothetical protein